MNNNVEAFGKNYGLMRLFFFHLCGETEKIREVTWGRKVARARLKLGTTRIEVRTVVATPSSTSMALECWWNVGANIPPENRNLTADYEPPTVAEGLSSLAKFRKTTITFVMSVSLSAFNNSNPTGRVFIIFHIWVFLENLSRKFKFN